MTIGLGEMQYVAFRLIPQDDFIHVRLLETCWFYDEAAFLRPANSNDNDWVLFN